MIVGIIGVFLSWLGLIGFGMWLAREESKK
jgi:hypothetical protein